MRLEPVLLWLRPAGLVFLCAALLFGIAALIESASNRKIKPFGGRFFEKRVELPVPLFRQADPLWSADVMGPRKQDYLGPVGCVVSSAAMILAYYGTDTDPGRLNAFLNLMDGYTERAHLKWEKAAAITKGAAGHVYEGPPSYTLMDRNIEMGNPVIVRVRLPSRITHFVVVAGKEGYDYLVRDPGAGAEKGLYPLREIGSDIEALRYYVKMHDVN